MLRPMPNEQPQTNLVAQGAPAPATVSGAGSPKRAAKTRGKTRGTDARPKKRSQARSGKKSSPTGKALDKVKIKSTAPRPDSRSAMILKMIGRPKGATLAEIMKAASWQAHSVRGFVSTAGRRYGLRIVSVRNEGGDRVYHVEEQCPS